MIFWQFFLNLTRSLLASKKIWIKNKYARYVYEMSTVQKLTLQKN
jgi:hypothetical protein